jgi:AraC-like DNA-binding protein
MTRRKKARGPRVSRIRAVVAELTLSGTVSLGKVADRLATSPRTLQRHLRVRGIRFRTIVDETRLGVARALLAETSLDVQEIAVRLGYSTPGAFSRAFARWIGCSPRSYRRSLRHAPPGR